MTLTPGPRGNGAGNCMCSPLYGEDFHGEQRHRLAHHRARHAEQRPSGSQGVEVYGWGHYLTITGRSASGRPSSSSARTPKVGGVEIFRDAASKAEARQVLQKLLRDLEDGTHVEQHNLTVVTNGASAGANRHASISGWGMLPLTT